MLESPLIRTLQLLDQEEFETLYLFVGSPIFNEVARFNDTVRLFEYLREHYPDFSSELLVKEHAGKSLFPERSNPAGEVEKAMSELMHILKQFINFRYSAVKDGKTVRRSSKKEFAQKPVLLLNYARQQLALMRFYSERVHQSDNFLATRPVSGKGQKVKRTENFFQNLYTELRDLLSEQEQFSHFEEYEFSDYHYYRFLLEQEKALYEHFRSKIEGDLNLLAALEELDRFYLLSKLELTSRLVHYQRMAQPYDENSDEFRRLASNRDITLLIIELMRNHGYWQDSPGIALHTTLLQFLAGADGEESDKISDRFAEMLYRHQLTLPKARLKDFNVMLRSYWNRRYRHTKDPEFLGRLHGMHLEELKYFTGNKNLPATHVLNMLSTALKLGKTFWAEQFLREYIGTLATGEEKSTRNRPYPLYSMRIWWAMLYFAQGDFEKADITMPAYDRYSGLDDIYFFAVAAALDVKTDYELDILDDNLIRAAAARIERFKDIPKDRRDERIAFFRIIRRLNNLKEKKATRTKVDITKDLRELQDKLHNSPIVDGEWLEAKIAELFKIESK